MSRLKSNWTPAVAAGIVMILAVRGASAGIVVSPLKQEVIAKPGRITKFHISIANRARSKWDEPRSVHLEVMDFAVTEAGGISFKPAGTVKNSASKWITISKPDLKLAPGKGQKVECTIKVPDSAVGQYYSAIMVTQGTNANPRSGLVVQYRTASGVFVTIAGRTFPKHSKIVRCEVAWPKPPADQPDATKPAAPVKAEPVKVLAVLKNTGRVRFVASGELRISDAQGRIVCRTPMTTKRARVLPGDTRLFEAVLDKALAPGEYEVKVELNYESKWGKARIRLPLTISADQAALLAKVVAQMKPAGTDKTSSEPVVELMPESLTATIPQGGLRSLKVVVKNAGKDTARCTVAVAGEGNAPIPASWMSLGLDKFTLGEGRSRALSLIVRVPSGAAGRYEAKLIVEAVGKGGTKSQKKIPLALTVGAGK